MGDEPLIDPVPTLDVARNEYEYRGLHYPRMTTILEAAGLRHPLWMVQPDVLERRRWEGEQVHLATRYLDEGTLDWATLPEELHPYVWAWERFKREHEYEITSSETTVVSRLLHFGGRYDRLGWRHRAGKSPRRSMVDIKTGVPNGAAYQINGYVRAHIEMHADLPFIEAIAVELRADGEYKLHGPYDNPRYVTMVQYASALYHERRDKGLLRPTHPLERSAAPC